MLTDLKQTKHVPSRTGSHMLLNQYESCITAAIADRHFKLCKLM